MPPSVSASFASARLFRPSICARCRVSLQSSVRASSSAAEETSPLMTKIKNDIKTAMRAKDTARLNTLRAIVSETNQSASSPNPIRTDMQLLALLKKRKASSLAAAQEAEKVGRPDLKEKQEKEVQILDEYAGTVKMMNEEELKGIVAQAMASLKSAGQGEVKQGAVMKELVRPGGLLDGKPLDKKSLSEIVQQALSS